MRKAAEIPLGIERGFITARAAIDDKPVTLLIDTGAESSGVMPSAMTQLHLREDRHRTTTIQGTGGTIVTRNAVLRSFGVGGIEILDQSAAVGPVPTTSTVSMPASGRLGSDWLRANRVRISYAARRVTLQHIGG